MTVHERTDPEFHGPAPKPGAPRPRRYLHVAVGLTVLGLLALPLFLEGRRQVRRINCPVNLKNIAFALYDYQAEYGAYPPAYTVDAQGRPLHSWRTLILPYLGQKELYDSIDLTKPWYDPANAGAFEKELYVYRCPESKEPPNTTTYLAITAPGGWGLPDRPRRLDEFADGLSKTLLVIEAGDRSAVPWMAPADADEVLIMGLGKWSRTNHSGGFFAAFGDGSIQLLKSNLPTETRRALLTIAGGEEINRDDY